MGSISLYALCLFLPAFTFDKYPSTLGKTLLGLGWFGILDGEFGWYANPLYPVALLFFATRHFAMSVLFSALVLGIALTSLQTKKWWVNSAVGSYPIGGYGYGFYLWLLSFAVLLIGALILARVSFLSRISSPSSGGEDDNV